MARNRLTLDVFLSNWALLPPHLAIRDDRLANCLFEYLWFLPAALLQTNQLQVQLKCMTQSVVVARLGADAMIRGAVLKLASHKRLISQ